MNKIELYPDSIANDSYRTGDLFISPNDEVYILCRINIFKVQAFRLSDGDYWMGAKDNILEAIEGLGFYGKDCKIQIYRKDK